MTGLTQKHAALNRSGLLGRASASYEPVTSMMHVPRKTDAKRAHLHA